MSSLLRYKKSGGFIQLLSLIETFGPQKKEKFLEMIDGENQIWGQALREKMLTLERIFSWPDQVVIEVLKSLPIKNMAVAMQGLKDDQRARMMVFFSASEKRRIDDALSESPPKPDDIASNLVKLVEMTRKMVVAGDLRPEKFDEKLLIPEDIETKLDQNTFQHNVQKAVDAPSEMYHNGVPVEAVVPANPSGNAPPTLEMAQLQRTAALLVKENKALKEEVRVLREKLDHIKRIA